MAIEGRSKGYIRLYRQVLENDFLMNDNNAYIVFTKLLLKVGREKGHWSGGRHQLAEALLMNPNTLYGVLKRLESQQLISITANSRYSIIAICNWHDYQNVPNKLNLDFTPARQQRDNTLTRTKEINNKTRTFNLKEKLTAQNQATKNSPGYLSFMKRRAELKV